MSAELDVRKHEGATSTLLDWFEPLGLTRFFDGLRPFADGIRVEEELVGDDFVIRAELPGVDPDKDVDVTIDGDVLTVSAERRKEEKTEKDGQFRSEFRYGSFRRSLRMPRGVTAADVGATYRDGILEVRVPVPKTTDTTSKVAISKS